MLYDVIVIGGGPGGYTAALYAARANLSVAIWRSSPPAGRWAPPMSSTIILASPRA